MKTKIVIALATVLVLALIAILYQSLVVIPKAELEAERVESELARQSALEAEQRREAKLELCVQEAYSIYSLDWDNQCEVLGMEVDCVLDGYTAADLNDDYDSARAECVTIYAN